MEIKNEIIMYVILRFLEERWNINKWIYCLIMAASILCVFWEGMLPHKI